MSEVSPKARSKRRSVAAKSFFVSEKAGPWKPTETQGSVGLVQGRCA